MEEKIKDQETEVHVLGYVNITERYALTLKCGIKYQMTNRLIYIVCLKDRLYASHW